VGIYWCATSLALYSTLHMQPQRQHRRQKRQRALPTGTLLLAAALCCVIARPAAAKKIDYKGNCFAGFTRAVGTIYDSWPKPGTTECIAYSGCRWAGQFASLDAGPKSGPCKPPAQRLDGGDGRLACR